MSEHYLYDLAFLPEDGFDLYKFFGKQGSSDINSEFSDYLSGLENKCKDEIFDPEFSWETIIDASPIELVGQFSFLMGKSILKSLYAEKSYKDACYLFERFEEEYLRNGIDRNTRVLALKTLNQAGYAYQDISCAKHYVNHTYDWYTQDGLTTLVDELNDEIRDTRMPSFSLTPEGYDLRQHNYFVRRLFCYHSSIVRTFFNQHQVSSCGSPKVYSPDSVTLTSVKDVSLLLNQWLSYVQEESLQIIRILRENTPTPLKEDCLDE